MNSVVLSDSQKYAIRSTWKLIEKDVTNNGIAVFLRIFDQNPEIKQLFSFKDVWGDALLEHPKFKGHAER